MIEKGHFCSLYILCVCVCVFVFAFFLSIVMYSQFVGLRIYRNWKCVTKLYSSNTIGLKKN